MKKLLSLAVILMVCCSSAIFFGCQVEKGTMTISGTTSITISQEEINDQNNAYSAAYDTALKGIKITVTDADGVTLEQELTLYDAVRKGASVLGFSLMSAGTRTATVTMYGISEEFSYTVTIGNAQNPPAEVHPGFVDQKNNETEAATADGKCDVCGNPQSQAAGTGH